MCRGIRDTSARHRDALDAGRSSYSRTVQEQGDHEIRFEGSDGRRLVAGFAVLALAGAAFFGTRLFREFTDGETNHSPTTRTTTPANTKP